MARYLPVGLLAVVALLLMASCGGSPPAPTAAPPLPVATEGTSAATAAATAASTAPPLATLSQASPAASTPRASASLPFADDFSNPNSGWPVGTYNKDTVEFRGGKYHILIGQENFLRAAWLTDFNVSDVSVEADASLSGSPDDGMTGVVCRVDAAKNSYYGFMFGADKRFTIVKVVEGKTSTLSEYFQQPSTIRPPQQSNHIRADCVGNRLVLMVNDQKLIENEDGELTGGSFGMIASTGPSGKSGVDATFTRITARAASPLPSPVPTSAGTALPAPGNVVFRDDFSSAAGGWPQRDDTDARTEIAGGALHVMLNKDNTSLLLRPGQAQNLTDVSLEVNVDSTGGPIEDSFGLACRVQDELNYYRLVAGADGFYGIAKVKAGENTWLAFHESLSSSIKARKSPSDPGKSNVLRADCSGSRLALYANGRLLDEVQDGEFQSGGYGLRVGTEKAGAEIFFKDFVARAP